MDSRQDSAPRPVDARSPGPVGGTAPAAPPGAVAWLDVCWRAVLGEARGLYPAIEAVLAERAPDPEVMPSARDRYRYHAIRALLLEAAGRPGDARRHARDALVEKASESPGYRFHPRPVPPDPQEAALDARLVGLAA